MTKQSQEEEMNKSKEIEELIEEKIKMYLGCYPPELRIRMTIDEHWTCMPTSKLRGIILSIVAQAKKELIAEIKKKLPKKIDTEDMWCPSDPSGAKESAWNKCLSEVNRIIDNLCGIDSSKN